MNVHMSARNGYKILADIWDGMLAGLDRIGPAGILGITVIILVLLMVTQ